jgi:hypothetical protein
MDSCISPLGNGSVGLFKPFTALFSLMGKDAEIILMKHLQETSAFLPKGAPTIENA